MPEDLQDVERELMLLARHHVLPSSTYKRSGRTLDRSAYLLLSRIEVEGPMSIGQLADAFALDVSTVNRQTAAMLQAGLVERIPDPDGGVARKLAITPDGLRRLHDDRGVVVGSLATILADWSDEDRRSLAEILGRFNIACERLNDYAWPRPARVGDH
ncbi:Transcriptional regulator, MarR family [Frankia canadensis]|uniref:Transcriptional regulator, MarR family n=1 Tax=Frankia canadensis TaxID=1836972 RepID=A0A2I2KX19_9ACTN|nr:MarR family transcriptional regulator [Frankia canadensis]SNQ50200.1 Transcriptional regulator, MarR family [Frankia canadensis]SOU57490.1 Transcriptional regulator, MarR family [Frankia canadensis]